MVLAQYEISTNTLLSNIPVPAEEFSMVNKQKTVPAALNSIYWFAVNTLVRLLKQLGKKKKTKRN